MVWEFCGGRPQRTALTAQGRVPVCSRPWQAAASPVGRPLQAMQRAACAVLLLPPPVCCFGQRCLKQRAVNRSSQRSSRALRGSRECVGAGTPMNGAGAVCCAQQPSKTPSSPVGPRHQHLRNVGRHPSGPWTNKSVRRLLLLPFRIQPNLHPHNPPLPSSQHTRGRLCGARSWRRRCSAFRRLWTMRCVRCSRCVRTPCGRRRWRLPPTSTALAASTRSPPSSSFLVGWVRLVQIGHTP